MKDEGEGLIEELEKMKGVNFFQYLITGPVKGDGDENKVDSGRKDCFSGNHCGNC